MKTASLFALLACLSLSGCAALVWDKPGATQQDLTRDSYECERDMRQSGYYGGGIIGAITAQEFGMRCMYARGWTSRKQ